MRRVAGLLASLPLLAWAQSPWILFPPLPGLESAAGPDGSVFSRGYDPLAGDVRGPLLQWTYEMYDGSINIYSDPISGVTSRQPDQVTVFNVPASVASTDLILFLNFTYFAEWASQYHSSSAIGIFVNYASFAGTAWFAQSLEVDNKVLIASNLTILTNKYILWPSEVVQQYENTPAGQPYSQQNSDFNQGVAALPEDANSPDNQAAYMGFIRRFGTHYLSSAFMGGQVLIWVALETSFVETFGIEASLQFSGILIDIIYVDFGFAQGGVHTKADLSLEFIQSSQVLIQAVGGDALELLTFDYLNWASSVPLQPAPILSTYASVSELFTDTNKAAVFQQVASNYLNGNVPLGPPAVCGGSPGQLLNTTDVPNPPSAALQSPHAKLGAGQRRRAFTVRAPGAPEVDGLVIDLEARSAQPEAAKDLSAVQEEARGVLASAHQRPSAGASMVGGTMPGLDVLGAGFDMVTGAYRARVGPSPWAFTQNNSFFDINSLQFFPVPDGVEVYVTAVDCFKELETLVANSTAGAEFFASITMATIGINVDDVGISGSFAQLVANFSAELDSFVDAVAFVNRDTSLYTMGFGSDLSQSGVSPGFQQTIANLPSTPSSLYQEVIDYFGTHVTTRVTVGASCHLSITYNQQATASLGFSILEEQFSIGFSVLLDGIGIDFDFGYNFTKEAEQFIAQFKENAAFNWTCYGGNPALLDGTTAGFVEWLLSVPQNPAPLSHTLRLTPLSSLVNDPVKQQLLQSAIEAYVNAAPNAARAAVSPSVRVNELARAPTLRGAAASSSRGRSRASPFLGGIGLPPADLRSGAPEFATRIPTATGASTPAASTTAGTTSVAGSIATPIPGLCSPNGGVGVGCLFDITKLTIGGLDVNPMGVGLKFTYCPSECFFIPMPSTCSPYCQFSVMNNPNLTYSVPMNVILDPTTESGVCYELDTSTNIDNYTQIVQTEEDHSGFMSYSSTTVYEYYNEYFRTDSSLALMYKHLIYYGLVAPTVLPGSQTLDDELVSVLSGLPATYATPSDKQAYRTFISNFGTHVMTYARLGGSALMTQYFHSCFLSQESQFSYSHEQGSSFFGFYNDGSGESFGFNSTSVLYQAWSQTIVKLLGGNTALFPGIGSNGTTLNPGQCQEWENTVLATLIPVQYSLDPISQFMTDATRAANLAQALQDYGADIVATNQNLMNSLVPADPYCKPTWCTFDPHPFPQPGAPNPPPPTPVGQPGTCTKYPMVSDAEAVELALPSGEPLRGDRTARAKQMQAWVMAQVKTISAETARGRTEAERQPFRAMAERVQVGGTNNGALGDDMPGCPPLPSY